MKLYFLLLSFITFLTFGLDKYYAIKQKSRIRETTLLLLTLIGGTFGALLGMNLFHHKILKRPFLIKFWSIVILQLLFILIAFYT